MKYTREIDFEYGLFYWFCFLPNIVIVAIVSLKSGDEAKCEGKLIDMVNNICNAFGKFHLLIPILFTAMKYIAMKILKQLTLSNIAFEYEEDKERIQREKMSSFVAIVGCIYIFLKG